jgi:hypothetical protein
MELACLDEPALFPAAPESGVPESVAEGAAALDAGGVTGGREVVGAADVEGAGGAAAGVDEEAGGAGGGAGAEVGGGATTAGVVVVAKGGAAWASPPPPPRSPPATKLPGHPLPPLEKVLSAKNRQVPETAYTQTNPPALLSSAAGGRTVFNGLLLSSTAGQPKSPCCRD